MADALSHTDDGDGMDRRIHRQDARCASSPTLWMARLASVRVMEEATRRQIGRRDRLGEETNWGKRQTGGRDRPGKRQTGGRDGRRRPCWNTYFLHISQSWYNDIAPTAHCERTSLSHHRHTPRPCARRGGVRAEYHLLLRQHCVLHPALRISSDPHVRRNAAEIVRLLADTGRRIVCRSSSRPSLVKARRSSPRAWPDLGPTASSCVGGRVHRADGAILQGRERIRDHRVQDGPRERRGLRTPPRLAVHVSAAPSFARALCLRITGAGLTQTHILQTFGLSRPPLVFNTRYNPSYRGLFGDSTSAPQSGLDGTYALSSTSVQSQRERRRPLA
jgi:hypothetical protein